jgi:hypothetical protein
VTGNYSLVCNLGMIKLVRTRLAKILTLASYYCLPSLMGAARSPRLKPELDVWCAARKLCNTRLGRCPHVRLEDLTTSIFPRLLGFFDHIRVGLGLVRDHARAHQK